ncbi:MAG: FadR family transcriptional regulator [Desulfobacteraceae bacterium]|nr:MAG: FadR family transcriptional regulator [Desulfobacteraceae bacterium]
MNNQKAIFAPIKRTRTFEDVSDKIKQLIFDDVLKPGEKLPSEAQLAQQFGVGRQTVREALRLLEISGFITIHRGGSGGPIIKDTILNRISDLFLDAFRIKKVTLAELTVARLEIEKVVLNHVIDNVEESDIRSLQKNVAEARKKIDNNIVATEENIQFHILLAQASRNHVFFIVVESIMAIVGDFLSRIGPDVETSDNVVSYHEDIVKAIAEKKRTKAINLLEQHLLEVRNRLKPFVNQKKESNSK